MGKSMKNAYLYNIFVTNEGYDMLVVEYFDYDNVIVEIQDEYKHRVKTGMGNVKKGKVKNPYHKSVYGVGYLGVGEYSSRVNYKLVTSYKFWKSMTQRCYDLKFINSHPEYKDCTVCEEWHNFQNFAKWHEENYYEIGGRIMNLDKDMLYKSNKIYSPCTCVYVPDNINLIFANHFATRGDYPIGVSYNKKNGKYESKYRIGSKTIHLGDFDSPKSAFMEYKYNKERYLKYVAEKYKYIIPKKLYNALCDWKIEITD